MQGLILGIQLMQGLILGIQFGSIFNDRYQR